MYKCDATTETWRTYNVDVTVPHSDNLIDLNVRSTLGNCGGVFAFDLVKVQVSDITPSPFRPYNLNQLRNRKRVQQDAHSWIQFDTPDHVTQASWLSFSFKVVNIATTGRQFIVNLIDLTHAKTTFKHRNCMSTANCGDVGGCTACRPDNVYYRICYWNQLSGSGVSGCDEVHFPT